MASSLAARTTAVMQRLRRATYARDDTLPAPVDRPFVFYAPNLCGEYPIFIFGSYRCEKYLRGLCTPCYYSGLPHTTGIPREAVYGALQTQVDALLENFDEFVFSRQAGTGEGYRLPRLFPAGRFADFELAGEGSFLADREVPEASRREILEKVAAFADRERLDLHVGLEVKAEDVIAAERAGELARWEGLICRLNLTLLMGMESADSFVRNVIFNKGLSQENLEEAIAIGHRRGMRPTCFVYAGCHVLTGDEIVSDTAASMRWLRARGAGVYLMLPNLQPHTVPHVLYHAGVHELIDVRTALPIVDALLEGGRGDGPLHYHDGWDWNIGGLTSEPDPELNIFTNPRSLSCEACRASIRSAVTRLAVSRDEAGYREEVARILRCPCIARWDAAMRADAASRCIPMAERLSVQLALLERTLTT